jgi:hypothetical protein
MKAFYAALVLYASGSLAFASQTGDHNFVLIDRKKRSMSVVSESGKILVSCPVGIGRGPLKNKSNMQDCITPVGEFFIDVVLSDNPRFNDIAMAQKSQIAKNARFARLVKDGDALAKVFRTMNEQDFNRDGIPDRAYGFAYFGLNGKNTGPKLIEAGPSARWYSIALHGSPNEAKAIGGATSEGCIHVSQSILKRLLSEHLIGVGTRVHIKDGAESNVDVKRKSSVDDNEELVRVLN